MITQVECFWSTRNWLGCCQGVHLKKHLEKHLEDLAGFLSKCHLVNEHSWSQRQRSSSSNKIPGRFQRSYPQIRRVTLRISTPSNRKVQSHLFQNRKTNFVRLASNTMRLISLNPFNKKQIPLHTLQSMDREISGNNHQIALIFTSISGSRLRTLCLHSAFFRATVATCISIFRFWSTCSKVETRTQTRWSWTKWM